MIQFDSILPTAGLPSKLKSILSNPAAALSTEFMSYSKSSVVISTIFVAGRFHLKKPLSLLIREKQLAPPPFKFYHEAAARQSYLQTPLLTLVLVLFSPHLRLLPLKTGNPQSHPWRLEPTSSKTPLRLILWPLLMHQNVLNGIWNGDSFPGSFQSAFPRSIRVTAVSNSYNPMKCTS